MYVLARSCMPAERLLVACCRCCCMKSFKRSLCCSSDSLAHKLCMQKSSGFWRKENGAEHAYAIFWHCRDLPACVA